MFFAKTRDLAGTVIIIADIAWNASDRDAPGNRSILSELTVKDNDKVLEVSTGTGDNFRFLNKSAVYYGMDISLGMLKQAKKHVKDGIEMSG